MDRAHYRRKSAISRSLPRSKTKIFLPSCIFNDKLSSSETVIKFLHENYGLSFKKIAELLDKQLSSVYRSYSKATGKVKESLEVTDFFYLIPVDIFKDSKLTVLEALVDFLKKNYGLKFSEISALLMRDQNTVRTIFNRAQIKHETK